MEMTKARNLGFIFDKLVTQNWCKSAGITQWCAFLASAWWPAIFRGWNLPKKPFKKGRG